ncbi:MAG TPA: helix-turn-helix domain-containing protein, partial [Thermodesulfobacteriota bacterium]|nr:helix-turn-helix domain-containing protein [Thermodesulfobacteriota bacterium]
MVETRKLEKNKKSWSKQDSFGDMLRYWRKRRGRSQLDLSLDSGVSQRHISFVECGRSKASRDMVLDLSRTLDIPFRERNLLLLAAGYAPVYKENQWENEDMKPLRTVLDVVLQKHDPHPAIVMDRYWNVLMTNKGAQVF